MDTILGLEDTILLEVGPGHSLITLAGQKKETRLTTALTSLPEAKSVKDDYSVLLNTLGQLWLKGLEPDWSAFYEGQSRQKVLLPTYVFDRKPCWVDPPKTFSTEQIFINEPEEKVHKKANDTNQVRRKPILLKKISEIIMKISGIELEDSDFNRNFLEFGIDSLILTQMALILKKEFDVPISFRQLNEDYETPEFLADYLDQSLPAERYSPKKENALSQSLDTKMKSIIPDSNLSTDQNQNSAIDLITEQLKLLGRQIEQLQGNGVASTLIKTNEVPVLESNLTSIQQLRKTIIDEKQDHKKPVEELPRIGRSFSLKNPPVSGAKLGRDENGNPAWFIEDVTRENGYLKIEI
jgi:acyl transferase domain-containing protein